MHYRKWFDRYLEPRMPHESVPRASGCVCLNEYSLVVPPEFLFSRYLELLVHSWASSFAPKKKKWVFIGAIETRMV